MIVLTAVIVVKGGEAAMRTLSRATSAGGAQRLTDHPVEGKANASVVDVVAGGDGLQMRDARDIDPEL